MRAFQTVSKQTDWSSAVANACAKALFDLVEKTYLSFHIYATHEGIRFRVYATAHPTVTQQSVTALFEAYYPGIEVIPIDAPKTRPPIYRRYTVFSRISERWFDPLLPNSNYASLDPLIVVGQTIAALEPGESIAYMVTAEKVVKPTDQEISEILTMSAYDAGWRSGSSYIPVQPGIGYMIGSLLGRWAGN